MVPERPLEAMEALASTGLNIAQFALLRAVGRLEAPNLSELAEEMALDRSTLGRNVLVLQRMRLLDVAEGEDLRARRITMTTRAQRLVDFCLPMWNEAQCKVEARLGKEGVSTLFDLLGRLEAAP